MALNTTFRRQLGTLVRQSPIAALLLVVLFQLAPYATGPTGPWLLEFRSALGSLSARRDLAEALAHKFPGDELRSRKLRLQADVAPYHPPSALAIVRTIDDAVYRGRLAALPIELREQVVIASHEWASELAMDRNREGLFRRALQMAYPRYIDALSRQVPLAERRHDIRLFTVTQDDREMATALLCEANKVQPIGDFSEFLESFQLPGSGPAAKGAFDWVKRLVDSKSVWEEGYNSRLKAPSPFAVLFTLNTVWCWLAAVLVTRQLAMVSAAFPMLSPLCAPTLSLPLLGLFQFALNCSRFGDVTFTSSAGLGTGYVLQGVLMAIIACAMHRHYSESPFSPNDV